jgi:hypothetical protein
MAGPGGMPRAGRPRRPNCGNGPARPQRSSLDHAVPVHPRRLCSPQENETGRVSISGGPEGLARRLGGHRRSLHPGTEFFRPPSIFLREVDRHQPGRFAPVRFGQRSPRKLLAAVVADGIEMDARRVIESACISRQTIDGFQHSSSCPLGCHPAPSVASPGNRKPPFAGAFRVGPPGFEPGSHGL